MLKKHSARILLTTIAVITGLSLAAMSLHTVMFDTIQTAAGQKLLPIYSVDTQEKKVAISFDAAWGDEHTQSILDTLDQYNIKATFFLVGFWVDKYPKDVEAIFLKGHEIGNHSSTHPNMSQISKEQIQKELDTTSQKIEAIISQKPTLFRPPFGGYNNTLIETAEELGYQTIQWDVDPVDLI